MAQPLDGHRDQLPSGVTSREPQPRPHAQASHETPRTASLLHMSFPGLLGLWGLLPAPTNSPRSATPRPTAWRGGHWAGPRARATRSEEAQTGTRTRSARRRPCCCHPSPIPPFPGPSTTQAQVPLGAPGFSKRRCHGAPAPALAGSLFRSGVPRGTLRLLASRCLAKAFIPPRWGVGSGCHCFFW